MDPIIDLSPAKWIWLPSARTLPNTFVLFRREFELDKVPDEALAWIGADSRYLVYVNGTRVQWGPAPHDPRHPQVDPLALKSHLKVGQNCIAVRVLYYGHPEGTWPFGKPGFILKMPGELGSLSTDTSWKCQVDRSQTPGGAPRWYLRALQESRDLNLEPDGWQNAGFDDSKWVPAMDLRVAEGEAVAAGPYGDYKGDWWIWGKGHTTVEARSIPLIAEKVMDFGAPVAVHDLAWHSHPDDWFENRQPGSYSIQEVASTQEATLAKGKGRAFTFDLKGSRVGFPIVEIEAPKGTVVEFLPQESVDPKGDGWLETHFHSWSRFVCREGLNRLETFDYEGLRFLQVHVHGDSGTAKVKSASLRVREFPFPNKPLVRVSDLEIQKVLDANIQTLRNSCIDICVDGMGRERQQYSGDCGHQHHFLRLAFGEYDLTDRYLRTYAQGQMMDGVFCDSWPASDRLQRLWQKQMGLTTWGPIVDHSIGFVFDHWNHYWESGRLSPVRDNWARMIKFVDWIEASLKEDLLDPEHTGMNAVWIDHEAFRSQAEKALSYNLYAAAMLKDAFVKLAGAMEDSVQAERGESLSQRILTACKKQFKRERWQNATDGRIDDRSLATLVLHFPEEQIPAQSEDLAAMPPSMGRSYPCNTPWNYWALAKLGKIKESLNDLRSRWAPMPSISQNGAIQEMWEVALGSHHLMSHCAVGPLAVFYHGVLGFSPVTPGAEKFSLQPNLGGLDHAEGNIQTPRGPIHVKLEKTEVSVVVPPGSHGELHLGSSRIELKPGEIHRIPCRVEGNSGQFRT